jgi:hypothetical protein
MPQNSTPWISISSANSESTAVNGGGMLLQHNAIVFILYRLLTKIW